MIYIRIWLVSKEEIQIGLSEMNSFSGLSGFVINNERDFSYGLNPAKIENGEIIFLNEKKDFISLN